MQMWEYMGKLMLNEDLLMQMAQLGFNDQEVYNRTNRDGGYHMSRAEISDVAGLLGQRVFLDRARALGLALRTALGDPLGKGFANDPALAPLRQIVGLLCIDTSLREAVNAAKSENEVNAILVRNNFPAGAHAAIILQVLGSTGTAIADANAIHACWSPPECYSAISFSDAFVRPKPGGVIRDVVVQDHGHSAL